MKSVLIWLSAVVIGGGIGYGIGILSELNIYLTVGLGIIVGSSIGVTINIHRERDFDFFEDEINILETEERNPPEERINQKAS